MENTTYTYIERIELSQKELELIKHIGKEGYAEYRDSSYDDLESFKSAEKAFERSDESFLARNTGGTYAIAIQLDIKGMVEHSEDSWHTTYVLTERGKKVLKDISK